MTVLAQGARIGILGGGQLGRMLALAGAQLGFDMAVFSPGESDPAARVAWKHWQAEYDDAAALEDFAKACDAVTLEFENVPTACIDLVSSHGTFVAPGKLALETSQDRVVEKRFLNSIGIPTAPFHPIHARTQLGEALSDIGGHGILKTRRDGYDGKGQARLSSLADIPSAWNAINHAPAILEAMIDFDFEVSAIIARSKTGETTHWACPRNHHENGILVRSSVPSGLSPDLEIEAHAHARALAEALDYVGVLALEFFVSKDGRLIANEFAPRVHNSGHWTPELSQTGQFEQHIRAVAGWPLGRTDLISDGEMINLIGEDVLSYPQSLASNETLTLYGKADVRAGRKMGHLTRRLGPSEKGLLT